MSRSLDQTKRPTKAEGSIQTRLPQRATIHANKDNLSLSELADEFVEERVIESEPRLTPLQRRMSSGKV